MPSLSAIAAAIRPGVFADLQRHIDAFAARGGDLIPLHLGDTYLDPPPGARFGALAFGHTDDEALYRYGPTSGLARLRDAIADDLRVRARGFAAVSEKHVLVASGATHALACTARAVLGPGDEVLLAAPYWPLAHGIVQSTGARAIEVPFSSRLYRDPVADAAEILRESLTPKTRALYLTTPNNPDGKVLRRDQLTQVARLACEKDLWVFADEVYADFTFALPHVSIASLPGMAERSITVYSFSKSHALAGARVGFAVAPEKVVQAARRVSTHSVFNVPVLTQRSAVAALADDVGWTEHARQIYRSARDASVKALEGSRIRFAVAEGGAYLFLDFTEVLDEVSLAVLLERAIGAGVLIAPGEAFGGSFEKWGRLCFTAVPLPRLLEGVGRLRSAVEGLSAHSRKS
jgi:aspartate/methionine/tyrosine aminotransferase